VLLAATEQMVFGTGIANIWARSPQTAHGAAALLAQAYPDRFVLGLGVGYPQQAESVGRTPSRSTTSRPRQACRAAPLLRHHFLRAVGIIPTGYRRQFAAVPADAVT
jgi:alkanesulfonate monooxygenase SsuD/methylene tetrahydromethanopterin reductase-like flavin-dependent oxidoreductase (luciferase family)